MVSGLLETYRRAKPLNSRLPSTTVVRRMHHMPTNRSTEASSFRPLPPFIMLQAFEAAVRCGSMRAAAQEIGVSHTVISRHVANLEYWMRTKLVETGPRGVKPTHAGRTLFDSVGKAFAIIGETTTELRPRHPGGVLRIWCIPGLATRWLTPRLSILVDILPETDIVMRATDEVPDFVAAEADIQIGFGDFDALPAGAIPLLRPRMFPVVSPGWLALNGRPEAIEHLAAFPLIHEESHKQWSAWLAAAGSPTARLRGPRLSDANLGYDAAMAGQGIALVTSLMTARELADGALVELFDTDIHLGGYYLLVAARMRNDHRIRRFAGWLRAEMMDEAPSTGSAPESA
jgi:LysR family glycine cleavage system transcriptional activator